MAVKSKAKANSWMASNSINKKSVGNNFDNWVDNEPLILYQEEMSNISLL